MRFRTSLMAATAALALGIGAANAITYTVAPGGTDNVTNDFYDDLEAIFGVGDVGFGIVVQVDVTEGEEWLFEEVGAESGFINSFEIDGEGSMTEANDMNIATVEDSLSGVISSTGTLPVDALMFTSNFGTTAMIGDIGFGVFYDLGNFGETSGYIYLAYDDEGAGPDDNHDDMLVRTMGDINVVPLPAAGWLLLAGIGGLAAMRRRKS